MQKPASNINRIIEKHSLVSPYSYNINIPSAPVNGVFVFRKSSMQKPVSNVTITFTYLLLLHCSKYLKEQPIFSNTHYLNLSLVQRPTNATGGGHEVFILLQNFEKMEVKDNEEFNVTYALPSFVEGFLQIFNFLKLRHIFWNSIKSHELEFQMILLKYMQFYSQSLYINFSQNIHAFHLFKNINFSPYFILYKKRLHGQSSINTCIVYKRQTAFSTH